MSECSFFWFFAVSYFTRHAGEACYVGAYREFHCLVQWKLPILKILPKKTRIFHTAEAEPFSNARTDQITLSIPDGESSCLVVGGGSEEADTCQRHASLRPPYKCLLLLSSQLLSSYLLLYLYYLFISHPALYLLNSPLIFMYFSFHLSISGCLHFSFS